MRFILYLRGVNESPFGVSSCEGLLPVDGCHESFVRAAINKNV